MSKYEIENALSGLFFKKFSDFEKRIGYFINSFNRPGSNFYDLPNFENSENLESINFY